MKLAKDRPVKIVIIGAGGTGGYIIPHLYRIAFSSGRKRSVIAPQSIAANVFAATAVTTMLYYLLIEGELKTMRLTFSSRRLTMKPSV